MEAPPTVQEKFEALELRGRYLDLTLRSYFKGKNLDHNNKKDIETILALESVPQEILEDLVELELINKAIPSIIAEALEENPLILN